MIFVGMDVHVRNSYLSVSDKSGRRLKRGQVGNTLAEIAEFLGPFETQPMRVSLENTTNARAIHTLLFDYVCSSVAADLIVVPDRIIRRELNIDAPQL